MANNTYADKTFSNKFSGGQTLPNGAKNIFYNPVAEATRSAMGQNMNPAEPTQPSFGGMGYDDWTSAGYGQKQPTEWVTWAKDQAAPGTWNEQGSFGYKQPYLDALKTTGLSPEQWTDYEKYYTVGKLDESTLRRGAPKGWAPNQPNMFKPDYANPTYIDTLNGYLKPEPTGGNTGEEKSQLLNRQEWISRQRKLLGK